MKRQTDVMTPLVPPEFDVPRTVAFATFRLEALGPQHNERDHAAWSSSMEHIHDTFGFEGHPWPLPMTLDENLADMVMHAEEFEAGTSYTWSILRCETDEVFGCVYLYPLDPPRPGAGRFRCWVTEDRASDDEAVRSTLSTWFAQEWPIDVNENWNSPR